MAKFSIDLFEIGDEVKITDGEHYGSTGIVMDWRHIGTRPSDSDTVHIIGLVEPKEIVAKQETPQSDGSKVVREEKVTLTRVEVPASKLAPV